MIKELELTNGDFNLAVTIIQKKNDKLSIRLKRKYTDG